MINYLRTPRFILYKMFRQDGKIVTSVLVPLKLTPETYATYYNILQYGSVAIWTISVDMERLHVVT